MPDIEKRLKALEKRGRADDERWQMLDAQTKAFSSIFIAIGAPICAANPSLLPAIIKNLKAFEDDAVKYNEHAKMVLLFRRVRKLFEERAAKIGKAGGA